MKIFKIIFILLLICFIILISLRGIFVNKETAINALKTQGYTNIQIIEKHYLLVGLRGCDEKDAAVFEAIAVNPRNEKVQILVCNGWPFKGSTIRSK